MITRNFKNLLSGFLQATTLTYKYSSLPIKDVNGKTWFLSEYFSNTYPASITTTPWLMENRAGISVGTGTNPESELDYNLQSTIISGITLTLASTTSGMDGDNVYLQYTLAVTNNGSSPITITEVGYKQTFAGGSYPGSASVSNFTALIDRTLLPSPLTLQPGDAGTIQYRLQANPVGNKTKEGIKLVSWTYGTDEEIGILIDAARQGIVDLQADAKWGVGDIRYINVGPWIGSDNVSHEADTLAIVISQFGDYNSCGCLFQFDFVDCVAEMQKMNSTSTNVGGYGATSMYTITLPALYAALPGWLNTRMKEFSVLTSSGNRDSTIESVTGNKLALRSEIEVSGDTSHSYPGEGTLIDYYKAGVATRKKYISTGGGANWWLRSPAVNTSDYFCYVMQNTGLINDVQATGTSRFAPFGCI